MINYFYNVIVNNEKWKLKEFSIQWKSLILDLCNILYLDINHAGSILRRFICNLQKPIPAIACYFKLIIDIK